MAREYGMSDSGLRYWLLLLLLSSTSSLLLSFLLLLTFSEWRRAAVESRGNDEEPHRLDDDSEDHIFERLAMDSLSFVLFLSLTKPNNNADSAATSRATGLTLTIWCRLSRCKYRCPTSVSPGSSIVLLILERCLTVLLPVCLVHHSMSRQLHHSDVGGSSTSKCLSRAWDAPKSGYVVLVCVVSFMIQRPLRRWITRTETSQKP